MADKTTILITDAHTVTRAGLRGILQSAGDMCVVGEVENLKHAPRAATGVWPRVVIVACFESQDLDAALLAIRILKNIKRQPAMWVVFIGSDEAIGNARQAGADDALSQHLSKRALREAVRNCQLPHTPKWPLDATIMAKSTRVQVARHLGKHFSLSELADLSFELGVDFEDIAGEDHLSKIRNLVLRFEREDRIRELEAVARAKRTRSRE